MIKAVKKDTGNLIYMRLQKHSCPVCKDQLKVVKMKKVVKANTREAQGFDFTACNTSLGEKVKFIWFEFKCKSCDRQYTEAELKAMEKKARREAREAKKEEKKAARANKQGDQ